MKRTPLRRTAGLTSHTPLRRHKGVNPVSKRRQRERPQRDACCAIVLARDRVCRYPGCQFPSEEVHELQGGFMRALTYLNPEACIGLCAVRGANHHQWVTEHPVEAHDLGLAYWSWEEVPPQ